MQIGSAHFPFREGLEGIVRGRIDKPVGGSLGIYLNQESRLSDAG